MAYAWDGSKAQGTALREIVGMLRTAFAEYYPMRVTELETYFDLPDGLSMCFFTFCEYGCIGIDYGADDGDLYYPEDYASFDALCADMLEETRS